MSIQIPITADLVARNLSLFEAKFNKTVPATDKAYIRAWSVALAEIETELEKKLDDDAKQNLALTANGDGLEEIGVDGGAGSKTPAEAAILTGTIPSDPGKTLSQTISFVGDSNGVRYFPDADATESGGLITMTVTAEDVGIAGNLEIGDTMTISSQVAGIGSVLTITVVDNIGASAETDDSYRPRVLDNQRALKGGGNSADYRRWAEVVAGVARAYPYAGLPLTNPGVDTPPDRTVYIEADSDIDPDGIAPPSLLTEVREAINIDPVTGIDNEPLGLVDVQLFVESITRISLFFEVRGLDVPAADEANVKSEIEDAFESYSRNLDPFVDGLDFVLDKNDTITDLTISDLVQGILDSVGGDAEGVTFGLSPGVNIPRYTLNQGEKAKSGGVVFVT